MHNWLSTRFYIRNVIFQTWELYNTKMRLIRGCEDNCLLICGTAVWYTGTKHTVPHPREQSSRQQFLILMISWNKIIYIWILVHSKGSSAGQSGVWVLAGIRDFSLFQKQMSRRALGPTQPPSQWVWSFLSLGVKWPVCEIDHSPTSSAKVKNEWIFTSAPPICLQGMHRNNYTF